MRSRHLAKILVLIVALLIVALFAGEIARAQAPAVTGLERNVIFTPPTATIYTNVSALNFVQGTGMNTFMLDVQPTVSARIFITNQTGNSCIGNFQLTLYATASQSQTFNNALQLWQTIPVISGTNTYVGSLAVDLPANQTVYITSAAIGGNRVAIQLVNTGQACSSTNLDLRVEFTGVSITAPLLSNNGSGNFFGTGDVQGVIPQQQNGAAVFPVIGGAVEPAINAGFQTVGVDTFGTGSFAFVNGLGGNVLLGNPPQPSSSVNLILATLAPQSLSIGGTNLVAPWQRPPSPCGGPGVDFLRNGSSASKWYAGVSNTNTVTAGISLFTVFAGAPQIRQCASASAGIVSLGSNTLAGSTIYFSIFVTCAANPCAQPTPGASSQGTTPVLVKYVATLNNGGAQGLAVYVDGPTSAAAYSVTFTGTGDTFQNSELIELQSPTPANPNTPAINVGYSNPKFLTQETDNGGQFIERGGFVAQQSGLVVGASTTIPLFQQSQHGAFHSCSVDIDVTAATGTTPTLNTYFQDSADGVRWNDRAAFPQITAAGNFKGAVGAGGGGITPVATTDGTMTVSTKLDGPISANGRLKLVVGGTTPSFTLSYAVVCQ